MRLILLTFFALLAGTGCRTVAYYAQATAGQCEIVFGQKSIARILEDPKAKPELKEKLRLVLELREFAKAELGMEPGDNYLRYRALDRKFVLWVVYATPEFDVNLKSWWYPVVGQFTTRGYFREAAAREYAAWLRGQGLDVFVGGAPAYSTLGWFDDPVLSTFIHYSETDLAELIFHELAHHHYFLPGDATFNESYATAVADLGVARWLEKKHDAEKRDAFLARRQREKRVNRMLFDTREKLKAQFAQELPPEKMRPAKREIIETFQTDLKKIAEQNPAFEPLTGWTKRPINNALLGAVAVYGRQVEGFVGLFAESSGSFPEFFAAVQALGELPKAERDSRLNTLED